MEHTKSSTVDLHEGPTSTIREEWGYLYITREQKVHAVTATSYEEAVKDLYILLRRGIYGSLFSRQVTITTTAWRTRPWNPGKETHHED